MKKVKVLLGFDDKNLIMSNKEIKKFGNAAHITLPKKYLKQKAIVVIAEEVAGAEDE